MRKLSWNDVVKTTKILLGLLLIVWGTEIIIALAAKQFLQPFFIIPIPDHTPTIFILFLLAPVGWWCLLSELPKIIAYCCMGIACIAYPAPIFWIALHTWANYAPTTAIFGCFGIGIAAVVLGIVGILLDVESDGLLYAMIILWYLGTILSITSPGCVTC